MSLPPKAEAPDRRPVVLSLEQALSMSYGTLRFVHEGYRVIRVEPTPVHGRRSKGDPNRYIGRPVAGDDRHSYYVAPNVGKEAIAIDLKTSDGQTLLHRLIRELDVDVFCTNTMPNRHQKLGIDYDTLRGHKDDIIWCCISAMGLSHPDVPGYDPALQALCGYMDLTGASGGPPTQCGPPIIDLKAGDEAFVQIILALVARARTGQGRQIDISMAQVAVSWLHTFLPMLDMGSAPGELRRSGNEHRQFIPVNAYRSNDGFVYIAIGSDAQWARFVRVPMFSPLAEVRFETNEGRRAHKGDLHQGIERITQGHTSPVISAALAEAAIPHAPITPIERVASLPFVASAALSTTTPDGRTVRLPPPAVSTKHLEQCGGNLPFAPAYGEHTNSLLGEVGLQPSDVANLRERGVVA